MMKKSMLVLPIVLFCALTIEAAGTKTVTRTVEAGDIDILDLNCPIGDVTIEARDALGEVSIEVELVPRRGGIFSSKRRAEQEIEEASLEAQIKHDRLKLRISATDDDDRRFEERWTIEMPSRLRVKIEQGVGDVVIRGSANSVDIESGVGDVEIDAAEGDIAVDLGVGTGLVRAPASVYGSAEAAGGVGSASIVVRGERFEGEGFVSRSASWSGDGRYSIEVSVGVGDAMIKLE
jgi:hypothetical protein